MEGRFFCQGRMEEVEVKRKGRGSTVHFADGTVAPLQWVLATCKLEPVPAETEPPEAA